MSSESTWNCIIIGGGIAGYSCGIYTARAKLSTLIIEGEAWGGQLMKTDLVENYPGYDKGILGVDLASSMSSSRVSKTGPSHNLIKLATFSPIRFSESHPLMK